MKALKAIFTRYGGTNINNVRANYVFAPFYGLILYRFLTSYYNIPHANSNYPLGGALYLSIYSTLFYCYCSAFFQPDLDQHDNRPGKKTFPFGETIKNFGFGRFLSSLTYPINRLWYYFWHPFGALFTHRGIVHWPVLGVWVRIIYIYAWYIFIEGCTMRLGIYQPEFKVIEYWLMAFFPWTSAFGSVGFFVFCLPVYISDIVHSAVDLFESNAKGKSFYSPSAKKGILTKVYEGIRVMPRIISDHIKEFTD